MEQRYLEVEFNTVDDNSMMIEGVVNDFKWSKPLGNKNKFVERITPEAFKQSLESNPVVNLLFNHDKASILSSTKGGNMTLEIEERGLVIKGRIVPTTTGRDVYELIKAGIIGNMSFGFTVGKDEWSRQGEYRSRTVTDLNLIEVSIVENPAYEGSSIYARSLDDIAPNEIDYEELRHSLLANLTAE